MSLLRKLIGIWMMEKTVSSVATVFTRLLMSMAIVAILAAFSAVFLVIIMTGIIWGAYVQLTLHGWDSSSAILIIIAALAVLLCLCMYAVQRHVRKIAEISHFLLLAKAIPHNRFSSLMNAFMDGFHQGEPPRHCARKE